MGHQKLNTVKICISFVKRNAVMFIAFLAALVTSFVIPIDEAYFNYFDYKTLTCLFCVLAVVCALKNINFFYILARKIVHRFNTARICILALVYITFIGSMLIANDMALMTFLPLGYFVLTTTEKQKYMAFTFIMQNIAANLGGMLTPFGNPQNLYLYSKFNIPNLEFMSIMFIPFIASVAIITLCCIVFVKPEKLKLDDIKLILDPVRTVVYLLLFALSIAIVFRGIPYVVGLVVIPLALLVLDRKALKMVDYPLLFTFVFFFVFAGNMSRIDFVREFFSSLLDKNTLLFSILSCQFISNVPSAILLSQFTSNYADLLVGVNIGGVGTLISSLASLITFREYTRIYPEKTRYYLVMFSTFNFSFLILLTALSMFLKTL
ncbi:MAG: SLC13 family permease [Clostridia bacterium]|jgi:Na+/H+ antiporter NhaD/arsenite permease-like protein|nr:citrate transporter [Clostridiaceae bacterium]